MVCILRNVQGLAGIEPWTFWLQSQLAIHYTKEPDRNLDLISVVFILLSAKSADSANSANVMKKRPRQDLSCLILWSVRMNTIEFGESIYIPWNSVFLD